MKESRLLLRVTEGAAAPGAQPAYRTARSRLSAGSVFGAACRLARSFRLIHRGVGLPQDLGGIASLIVLHGDETDDCTDPHITDCRGIAFVMYRNEVCLYRLH